MLKKSEPSLVEKIRRGPKKAKWLVSGYFLVHNSGEPAEGKLKGFFYDKDELADLVEQLQLEANFEINEAEDALYRRIGRNRLMEALRTR